MAETVLGVGTGQWGHEILIAPSGLARACDAILANLVEREKPVFSA
jgi:hypothetical protein